MKRPDRSALEEAATGPLTEAGFETFDRGQWAALAGADGRSLSEAEAKLLAATGEQISADEIAQIYLPLAQFVALLALTKRAAHQRMAAFLVRQTATGPFIIAIAGGVAVGKSTTARVLQALLRRGDDHPSVDLLTTDGFLYPNATLEARGLMGRKGFPESYDQRRLVGALAALRAGVGEVATPVYSHLAYDIVPDEMQVLRRPDIVIVEGLNVLQVHSKGAPAHHTVVSDFFDFSIYVDAAEDDVARWYHQRLVALRRTVLLEPDSYFHRFASLSDEEFSILAQRVWAEVNLVNLHENVAPTRGRAHLVLEKDGAHRVERILLRRP
jgi:type I pantothenate kinase